MALLHVVALPPSWWPLGTTLYFMLLVGGSIAGVAFSVTNPAHDHSVSFSFFCMAMGSIVPAALAWHAAMYGAMRAHGHYLAVSFAALFGAAVVFRLMARMMVLVPPRRKNDSWKAVIWASWLLPALLCQWALSLHR